MLHGRRSAAAQHQMTECQRRRSAGDRSVKVGHAISILCVVSCLLLARGQEADTQDGVPQGYCGASRSILAEHDRARDQGAVAYRMTRYISCR